MQQQEAVPQLLGSPEQPSN